MNRCFLNTAIWALLLAIPVLSLLPGATLHGIYLEVGRVAHIDLAWVQRHSIHISDYGHFIVSSILTFLLMFRFPYRRPLLLILVLISLGLVELSQNLTPTREASWADLVVSFSGVGVGAVGELVMERWRVRE